MSWFSKKEKEMASSMETNISFRLKLEDKWSAVFQWMGSGVLGMTLHWDNKVQATHTGEVSLADFRKMLDTFEALDMGEGKKRKCNDDAPRSMEMGGPPNGRGSPGDPDNSMGM